MQNSMLKLALIRWIIPLTLEYLKNKVEALRENNIKLNLICQFIVIGFWLLFNIVYSRVSKANSPAEKELQIQMTIKESVFFSI